MYFSQNISCILFTNVVDYAKSGGVFDNFAKFGGEEMEEKKIITTVEAPLGETVRLVSGDLVAFVEFGEDGYFHFSSGRKGNMLDTVCVIFPPADTK